MNIRILGTRGNIKAEAPNHRLHSGILVDDTILLDIGEREYLNQNAEIIFITHLHPDHAYFVSGKNMLPEVPVYAPEPHPSFPAMRIIDEPVLFKEYQIIPLPVTHSLHVKSVGYVVKKGKKSIFYTGDIAAYDTTLLNSFGRQNLIVTEASFIRKGGLIRVIDGKPFGHLGIADIINLFKGYTSQIALTHFGSWFVKDPNAGAVKIKAFEKNGLQLIIAEDGLNITI